GAAAGCARLLDLDQDAWTQALGIAGTQAAGLKAAFGTMSKPLHAGKAAMNGLLAATLAARGFTGDPEIIEASQGFAEAHDGSSPDPSGLGEECTRFLILETLFKY